MPQYVVFVGCLEDDIDVKTCFPINGVLIVSDMNISCEYKKEVIDNETKIKEILVHLDMNDPWPFPCSDNN